MRTATRRLRTGARLVSDLVSCAARCVRGARRGGLSGASEIRCNTLLHLGLSQRRCHAALRGFLAAAPCRSGRADRPLLMPTLARDKC